jgi:hypothetical protein
MESGVNNRRMSGGQPPWSRTLQMEQNVADARAVWRRSSGDKPIRVGGRSNGMDGCTLDLDRSLVPFLFFLAAFCPFDVPLRLVVNVPRCAALSAVLLPGITKWRTGMQRVDGAGG